MTNGCADFKPNLVATEADAQSIENNKPSRIFFINEDSYEL